MTTQNDARILAFVLHRFQVGVGIAVSGGVAWAAATLAPTITGGRVPDWYAWVPWGIAVATLGSIIAAEAAHHLARACLRRWPDNRQAMAAAHYAARTGSAVVRGPDMWLDAPPHRFGDDPDT